jgi:hypothetical protein
LPKGSEGLAAPLGPILLSNSKKVETMAASEKLSNYRRKRDFAKTAGSSGETLIVAADRRRFVIQKHAATRLDYDLRLELDLVFKSWAVTRGPSLDPADKRLAVEVEDHPLDYATSKGRFRRVNTAAARSNSGIAVTGNRRGSDARRGLSQRRFQVRARCGTSARRLCLSSHEAG